MIPIAKGREVYTCPIPVFYSDIMEYRDETNSCDQTHRLYMSQVNQQT